MIPEPDKPATEPAEAIAILLAIPAPLAIALIAPAVPVGSELIPGGQGIFDVVVDRELVYSKFKTGSFPDEDQLINELVSLPRPLAVGRLH